MVKKAVSPMVATVLLVVFTIGISILIIDWIRGYTKETSTSSQEVTSKLEECNMQDIKIRQAYLSNTSARLIILNTGSAKTKLAAASIFNKSGHYCAFNITNATILDIGETFTLDTNCTIINKTCGNFDRVYVTTQCSGVSDTLKGTLNVICTTA